MKKAIYFISHLFIALISLLFSVCIFAKTIPLYEQPSDTSKQIGNVDIAKGVVPIFSQNNGAWIKVGDPSNGNVGWIKSNDMSGEKGSAVTFTQRIINQGNGPQTFQYIQYGPQGQMSSQQAQALMQQVQAQQLQMQQAAQQMFQGFHNWEMMFAPLVMPVVYVPVQTRPAIVKPVATKPSLTPGKVNPPVHPTPKVNPAIPTSSGAVTTAPRMHN